MNPIEYVEWIMGGNMDVWALHMFVVFLAAFLLAPQGKNAGWTVVIAVMIGVLAILILRAINHSGLYSGASMYWMFPMTTPIELWLIPVSPLQYVVPVFLCWIVPLAIAWMTVKWRAPRLPAPATAE